MCRPFLLSLTLVVSTAIGAAAQTGEGPVVPGATAGEFSVNYTTFFDDGAIEHIGVGGSMRVHLTPRLSAGPELAYLMGPGGDRDLLLLANLTLDFRRPMLGRPGRIEPYVIVGGGLLAHSSGSWSNVSRAVIWGGGARVWLTRRAYFASDVRLGWHPHLRVSGLVGILGQR